MAADAITSAEVLAAMHNLSPSAVFLDVRDVLVRRCGRKLTPDENRTISTALEAAAVARAAREREEMHREVDTNASVLLCTAYSEDYAIGRLCEHVNRAYAERHGYSFESVVLPYIDMLAAVSPRAHVTWYKCLLIRQLLAAARSRGISWIMWIDADALVIAPGTRVLEDLVTPAGRRELIVAEDMNPGCLLNAGVLLVRACSWSEALWDDVWADARYWAVPFYEQAALVGALRKRQERLEAVQPFHSHAHGGPRGPKLFAHVCVLPCPAFNSNRCALAGLSPKRHAASRSGASSSALGDAGEGEEDSACFIFHAAGTAEGGKLATLRRVLAAYHIVVPETVVPAAMHLFRGSHGRPPKPDKVAARAAAHAKWSLAAGAADSTGSTSNATGSGTATGTGRGTGTGTGTRACPDPGLGRRSHTGSGIEGELEEGGG